MQQCSLLAGKHMGTCKHKDASTQHASLLGLANQPFASTPAPYICMNCIPMQHALSSQSTHITSTSLSGSARKL